MVDDVDCGDVAPNEWLIRRARTNQGSGASRTWVATDDAGRVIGYSASSAAVVLRSEATTRTARHQPYPVATVLAGGLAVERRHQGRRVAAALLKHVVPTSLEVAEVTGGRVRLVEDLAG